MAVELFHTFDRARDEAAFIERRQANFVLDQGRDDGPDASSSVILGSDGTAREVAQLAKAEDKRRQDNADTQILLASLRQELVQLHYDIDVADDFLADLRSGKAPELTADGRIKDEAREKVVSDYEKRTGQTVDRNDVEALAKAVSEQRDHMKRRVNEIGAELSSKQSSPEMHTVENRSERTDLFFEAEQTTTLLDQTSDHASFNDEDFFGDGFISAASAIGETPIKTEEPLTATFERANSNEVTLGAQTIDVSPVVATPTNSM